ncbi:MAG TPA: TonB-dependent receptor [Terriglobales bacterium]|nr:TonB-dependent receptor [Terriglobales bacterium]
MRLSFRLSVISLFVPFVLSASALAAQFTVTVVDPRSAVVPGAQVELFTKTSSRPIAVESTSAQGVAQFQNLAAAPERIHVLAAGFAEQWSTVSATSPETRNGLTMALRLAPASETVVVTATRTPLPSDESGASMSLLSAAQLETMRPISAGDALRFLPGAVVNTAGQRGGLSSLFVDGGDSRYNKVIVDGVPVNDPGGTFDFGVLPLFQADRVEFLRGAQSTLYGSDAMSSVVQVWSQTGSTPTPELRFGADAGNYGTENGYASLAGARGRFDYNVFGNQFNTMGSGPNDDYSNSLEGINVGAKLNNRASLRLRMRHDHSVTGVQGEWNFNGQPLLSPDLDQRARQSNFLGDLELNVNTSPNSVQRFSAYEFTVKTANVDGITNPGRVTPFGEVDTPFQSYLNVNRAGFMYEGDFAERSWTQTVVGYEFEDENGSVNDPIPGPPFSAAGLRLNDAAYVEQHVTYGRLSATAGVRFVHNTTFGNTGVPRAAAAYRVLRGGNRFSGTQLNFSYATGIKEARFEETYANGPYEIPNPNLKPERNRALEAGFQQGLFSNKISFTGRYFNNLFRDQIEFVTIDPMTFVGQYVNLQESLAHGAEAILEARINSSISWTASYTYTSTQILQAPPGSFPPYASGDPLLRRPKHSASTLLTYVGRKWGGTLEGSFVGPRPDSDFYGFGFNHAPGYFLVDVGGWYAIRPRMTAYVNVENALDHFYEEVLGYPALGANFRAGMRFRIGGD